MFSNTIQFSEDFRFGLKRVDLTTFCKVIQTYGSRLVLSRAETIFRKKDMKTKLKTIVMPHGKMKMLVKSTGAAEQTCKNAIRGISCTDYAQMIRKRALELGGVMARD